MGENGEDETMIGNGRRTGMAGSLIVVVAVTLACGVTFNPQPAPPPVEPTKAALEFQATSMSLQLTQDAIRGAQSTNTPAPPPPAPAQTEAPPPPPAAAPVLPSPTPDVEAQIKAAKVLLYEDTDELGIGQWIQDAVEGMGLQYTQTGSYSGHFMEYLNSGIKYDLIIVGAEDRDKITGEFWDVINTRVTRDKTALIAEVWYLSREANGPISKILGPCGVRYRKEYDLAESIYWWTPTHPVFNEPNVVLPLLHYDRYWGSAAGDKLMIGGGGEPTLLAGLSSRPSSGEAVLASCFDGRVIIQTFCNHDYRQSEIIPLWQNYIHYTLKNHFEALTP
jgi:hypothetical protein